MRTVLVRYLSLFSHPSSWTPTLEEEGRPGRERWSMGRGNKATGWVFSLRYRSQPVLGERKGFIFYVTLGLICIGQNFAVPEKVSLNDSNETLITKSDWRAMGGVVLRCCPGNGRQMTQGSPEGHSPRNCTRASRLIIERCVCMRGMGGPGRGFLEDREQRGPRGGVSLKGLGVSVTWPDRRGGDRGCKEDRNSQ